jgi:hypothetical protein
LVCSDHFNAIRCRISDSDFRRADLIDVFILAGKNERRLAGGTASTFSIKYKHLSSSIPPCLRLCVVADHKNLVLFVANKQQPVLKPLCMKFKLAILFICLATFQLSAQKRDSLRTVLDLLNLKMDNYDFQFVCLDSALKYPYPDRVYEIYIRGCSTDYDRFPTEVLKFKNLKTLIIEDQDFNELPESISELKHLEILDISACHVHKLPEQLGNLNNLLYLNVSFNFIDTLPISLLHLTKLRGLNIGFNSLVSFPNWLLDMPSIQWIDLDKSECKLLPPKDQRRGVKFYQCNED